MCDVVEVKNLQRWSRGSGVSAVTAAAMDLEITGDDDAWASDVTRGKMTAQ